MAQNRDARLLTKRTSVPGKIPTGTTGNELNFIKSGELASNLADHSLWGYDGTNVFEYGSNSFLGLTGGTVTGNTSFIGNLSASTLFSGSTDVETIIYNILAGAPSSDITRVQPGVNIFTGGTDNLPTINLVPSPSINDLTISGTGTATIFSALTLSATTAIIPSSGLKLRNPANTFQYSIVSSAIVANRNVTIPLLTANDTFVTAAFSQTLTNKTINATNNTITDTSTALGDLFKSNGTKFVRFSRGSSLQHLRVNSGGTDLEWAAEDTTRVQPGTNITTGGTSNVPIVSTVASPIFNNISFSGTATGGNLSASSISASTVYIGGVNISGATTILKTKSGIAPNSGFTGNPDKHTVTFSTPFSNNNYSVVVTGEDERSWTIESKTASGFVINSNANPHFTGDVFWQAIEVGES